MTNSKNSSSPRDTSRRGSKSEKSAPGSNDQDRPLKLATARALASAGLYVRTNVVLSEHRAGSGPGEKWAANVTDVDVLAISHGIDLAADIACVTCKGGTNVSVLHETFALAGLMRYLHARRGYGVFAKKATEPHMIALGQQLDIALMSDAEWQHWRGRIAGSYPIPRTFEETIEAEVAVQLRKRSDLAPLVSYLRTEFWFYRDYRNVQHLVGQVRRAGERLNNSPLMQFVFLDACSLFALSILQLCEYVSSGGLLRLSETAPPYLFGGFPTYRNRRELLRRVEEFLRVKGVLDVGQTLPPLDPPYLRDLLELVLRWCSKPAAAARVPQYLNVRAGKAAAAAAGAAADSTPHGESDTTEKLAYDLVELLAGASRLGTRDFLTVSEGGVDSQAVAERPALYESKTALPKDKQTGLDVQTDLLSDDPADLTST